MTITLIILSFVLTVVAIFFFRKIAARFPRLLDLPNERSSHSSPVVRGAGISFVIVILGLYMFIGRDTANLYFVLAASAVATISFLDDLFSLPLLPRLIVHFVAASTVVLFCGRYIGTTLPLTDAALPLGIFGPVISVLLIVLTTNAFNFMDGIDGIASVQAVGSGLGWIVVGMMYGSNIYATLGALIVGACLAFLCFNWQPAKVFMGDVGSTSLGFTFGALPLIDPAGLSKLGDRALPFALLFLWLFLFDTVFTRLTQVARMQRFWHPHRDHLYQRLVIAGASHRQVAAFFGAFALLMAVATWISPTFGFAPVIAVAMAGPIVLLLWKKRLT